MISTEEHACRPSARTIGSLRPFGPPVAMWFMADDVFPPATLSTFDVRQALGENRLTLWYQPKINLATGRISGAEALVRLDHASRGILAPGAFLPLLDSHDLVLLTAWVAERAVADWGRFAASGLTVKLSINAPPSTFESGGLPKLFETLRPAHPSWPGLTVEMTETEIVQSIDVVRTVIDQLTAQGVAISIDDFGSGYSSLGRLTQIPFSEIKIDRSLIRHCESDDSIRIFLRAIRDFAHYHGASVVAEGVETADELAVVREIGIDEAQGFLFARPMPPQDFLRTIAMRHWND